MLSVQHALAALLSEIEPLQPQSCGLISAIGRILRVPVHAPHDSPPFDTCAMDGFAVRAEELRGASQEASIILPLQSESNAGDRVLRRLERGRVIRINTGAPLPEGADAVVKIEDVELSAGSVRFGASVAENTAIRRAGEDYQKGSLMVEAGQRLDPAALGLLASLGKSQISVGRKPRVALAQSGDELVEPGRPLGFGQIYNSTRYALIPLLESFGAEFHDLGNIPDDLEKTRSVISEGLRFDTLVTTGGVSMGSRDLIRPTMLELGVREIFWKVKQRPGQPLFVGVGNANGGARTLCFGLPGNPVSVFVTALVYVRAALLKMQGAIDLDLPWQRAIAAEPFRKPKGLTVFARANFADGEMRNANYLNGGVQLVPSPAQGSHQFSALSSSAGIVRLEEDSTGVEAGQGLDFLDFRFLH